MSNFHIPDEKVELTRAYIVHPETSPSNADLRLQALALEEAEGLARAIDLEIAQTKIINVPKIQARTLMGKGQAEAIGKEIEELEPNVVIINHTLNPGQQRNLEKLWCVKVIDRTGLILEIFGARAQTKEGRLQVELAALDYERSRLVRSWTHLERQRGGTSFIGGPGETQIEIDRRLIGERITRLKKELEQVKRTRDLGRQSRARVPLPVVSLVGYTNAGKSSLFNTLTNSDIFAEDLLFATLDPTMRRLKLPGGQTVILADTVGFISDLPTHLVAAFRATLEHVIHADIITHVMDVSQPHWKTQREDVIKILKELGVEYETDPRIFKIYNKIDLIGDDLRADLEREANFSENTALVSAHTGENTEKLLENVETMVKKDHKPLEITIPTHDGKAIAWLYEHGEIIEREDSQETVILTCMLAPPDIGRFEQKYSCYLLPK